MKKIRWIISLSLLLLGIGIIVTSMLPKATQYYVTVDELLAKIDDYKGIELKVAGKVVDGSIVNEKEKMQWDFQIEHTKQKLSIHYVGAMPDTFKEGADVVATGIYGEDNVFIANNILAKCASRYEEKLKPNYETKIEER